MTNQMSLYNQLNTANNGAWTSADANQMLGQYNASQIQPQTGLWDSLGSANTWNAFGNVAGGIGSLGNMFLGFQSLGLMEDQLGLQQEKWGEQKAELNTMRATRDKLNTSYMA